MTIVMFGDSGGDSGSARESSSAPRVNPYNALSGVGAMHVFMVARGRVQGEWESHSEWPVVVLVPIIM